jgi:hypothetical protein
VPNISRAVVSRASRVASPWNKPQAAIEAGYTVELPHTAAFGGGTCIANGAEGAMGIHMVSPGRIDADLDAADQRLSSTSGGTTGR